MFRVFIKGLESIPLITTKEGAISLIESFGKDKKFIDEIKRTKNLVSFKNDYISVEEDEISQVSEENEKNLDKDNVVKMKALEEEAKEKALEEKRKIEKKIQDEINQKKKIEQEKKDFEDRIKKTIEEQLKKNKMKFAL